MSITGRPKTTLTLYVKSSDEDDVAMADARKSVDFRTSATLSCCHMARNVAKKNGDGLPEVLQLALTTDVLFERSCRVRTKFINKVGSGDCGVTVGRS